MMAEMVAGEKKAENTDTESEDGGNDGAADDDDANDTGYYFCPYFYVKIFLSNICRILVYFPLVWFFPLQQSFPLIYRYRKCC